MCWTNQGAVDVCEIEAKQMQYRCQGEILHVRSVDKFPQMLDYVLPSDVRIANSAKKETHKLVGDRIHRFREMGLSFISKSV